MFWNNFKNFVFSPYKQGNVRLSRHIRWQSRTMCNHFLLQELQNYNLLLNNSRQENVGSHQKKTTHIQGQRRSPSKMVGGAKSCLESNPIPARDTLRAQMKPSAHQDPGNTQETEPELCLSVSCKGTGQQGAVPWAGALGTVHLGMAGCSRLGYGISLLGEGCQ